MNNKRKNEDVEENHVKKACIKHTEHFVVATGTKRPTNATTFEHCKVECIDCTIILEEGRRMLCVHNWEELTDKKNLDLLDKVNCNHYQVI